MGVPHEQKSDRSPLRVSSICALLTSILASVECGFLSLCSVLLVRISRVKLWKLSCHTTFIHTTISTMTLRINKSLAISTFPEKLEVESITGGS